jgi:hypothetical protein
MTPSFTIRGGPFGPSGVNARLCPSRAARIMLRNAAPPPRVLEPRTLVTL